MRASTSVEPACTGRWIWSQSAGWESMACTMSGVKITRMGSGKAHAPHAGHLRHARQQLRKAPARRRRVPPGIHDLAQNLDLRVTGVHQAAALGDNLRARAAALRPPRHGHHAEGAALVAAFDDGQISAEAVVAAGELGLKTILGVEVQVPSPGGFRTRVAPAAPATADSSPNRTPG